MFALRSMRMWLLVTLAGTATAASLSARAAGAGQNVPVPMPFPGAETHPSAPKSSGSSSAGTNASAQGAEPRTDRPAAPAAPASPAPTTAPAPGTTQAAQTPNEGGAPGVQIYPTAEFLESFDAGSGQRYYLYGTNASFADIVTYYKTVLRTSGRELSRTPGIEQFDLGKFQDSAMAFPPSVVVKDYTWNGSDGYLFVNGTTSKRFKTIIQIVPPAPPR